MAITIRHCSFQIADKLHSENRLARTFVSVSELVLQNSIIKRWNVVSLHFASPFGH